MKIHGFASLILALVLALPFGKAVADSGWVNNQGCYCGTYNPYPVNYISRGCGTEAERNASRDQMSYWNLYSTIYTPSVSTGLGAPGNGSNEVNTFITESDASTIYGYTMSSSLYGVAIIQPDANFGNFDECDDFDAAGCDDFTETDVLINSAFSNGWTIDPNNYCGPALIQTTALHEIGHTWGAHHVFTLTAFGDSYSTMNYINDDSGRFVTRMDANTIRAAYPATAKTVTDVAIFPFIFGNAQYGETYASVSPTNVSAGGSITVSNYLIQNIGTNAAADTVVSFYLSTDTTITSGDILLGTADFTTLAVNADSDQSATLTIPGSVADGVYYIGAIVTVGGSEDSITINNRFIIGRPVRTLIFVGGGGCIVEDGGFEDGTPNSYWTESSTNYSTPLCSVASCGSAGSAALTGTWWAWFGGVAGAVEEGTLEQSVTIDSGTQYLNFYLEIPTTNTTGYLRVLMDGTNIFEVTHTDGSSYSTYRPVSIDISAYADGGSHTLRFESRTEAGTGTLNFFVDDVCLNTTAFSDGIDCSAGGSSCSDNGDGDSDGDGDGDGDGGSSGCFIGCIRR
jgi:hypothetical protein